MKTLFNRPVRLTKLQVNGIKAFYHSLALGYLVWLFMAGVNDNLGGDPVEALLHSSGIIALLMLFFSLCLSHFARRLPCGDLIKCRRMAGVYVFVYGLFHLFTYIAFELQFDMSLVAEEIVSRPYILVGMLALLILFALTITSPMIVRKRMRQKWQPLHNLVYLALVLIVLHYTWSLKTAWQEPVYYWIAAVVLIALRFTKLKKF
ncbi:sulfite oxidase heme-binding subunit YedZ [Alteromonas confluentis]|uniref:Protein-methionine-sulfoxide reductase heme-binding subunit MsrQ n=1 Tax=Alteromonas confluentis TaxID=1656094 RepID=A0A1E7Z5R9_9ALTE|nr:protein-methionine-sulfoxide reductase heme-binding subunit MsrQ [Alteromonas confluentis]OFC68734.1 hypothetical protein BFC18_01400 [Alteromonas confluentis]